MKSYPKRKQKEKKINSEETPQNCGNTGQCRFFFKAGLILLRNQILAFVVLIQGSKF